MKSLYRAFLTLLVVALTAPFTVAQTHTHDGVTPCGLNLSLIHI